MPFGYNSFCLPHTRGTDFEAGSKPAPKASHGDRTVSPRPSEPESDEVPLAGPKCPSGRVHLEGRVKTGDHSRDGADRPVREFTPCLGAASSTSAGTPSSRSSAAAA